MRERASSCRDSSTDSFSGQAPSAPDASIDWDSGPGGKRYPARPFCFKGPDQARKAAALMSQPAATQLAIQAAMTAPISNHFIIVLLTALALLVQAIDV
jgi:hypothetical protein